MFVAKESPPYTKPTQLQYGVFTFHLMDNPYVQHLMIRQLRLVTQLFYDNYFFINAPYMNLKQNPIEKRA